MPQTDIVAIFAALIIVEVEDCLLKASFAEIYLLFFIGSSAAKVNVFKLRQSTVVLAKKVNNIFS